MKTIALLILNLLVCLQGISQQVYSLEDCFAVAKENNVSLKKSRNDIDISYIDKKAAIFNLLPAMYANVEHVFSTGKNIDPVTNNFVKDDFSGGEFDLTLQLNIFLGFTALNAIKSSLYKTKAGEYAYQKNELQTFSEITTAYARLMYAKEQVATIKNDNLPTQNELEVVQESINVGKLSKSDFYTINTRYKTEQAALAEAQNDSTKAINDLKFLTGISYNKAFDVKDVDSTEIKNIASMEFRLTNLLEEILKDHPALQESVYAEKSAAMNLKTAKGNLMPSVSLEGNIFSNYNLNDKNFTGNKIAVGQQLDNNLGKTVGVLVQIPIFNRYQGRFDIEKEKINLSNAKLAKQQIENDIVQNTQQLANDFMAAQKKYSLQTEALQQNVLAYDAYEERHKLGYISSLELIIAKDQLYAQQVRTIQAKYDLYFRYKLIELLLKDYN